MAEVQTINNEDIDSAVKSGILSDSQAAGLYAHIQERAGLRKYLLKDDEPFDLYYGFNEIFISIGLILLIVGSALFTGVLAVENPVASGVLGMTLSWWCAEYFSKRRRMVLPSLILLLTYCGYGLVTITYTIELLDKSGSYTLSMHAFFYFLLCMLFYFRFRLPFALFAVGVALFIAILSLANKLQVEMLNIVEPKYGSIESFDNFFNCHYLLYCTQTLHTVIMPYIITHSPVLALTTLAYGCIAFIIAMRFDLRDPHRVTRYAQSAFWLHLLAGPAIVNTVASTLYTLHSLSSLLVLTATVLIIAIISIVIDRRSMLMSAAIYMALLLYEVFGYNKEDNDKSLTAFFVMLVMGAAITLLGAHWVAWRGRLMRVLPEFKYKQQLPPYIKETSEIE